jgi:choline dehydrogenase-like flavoprotein
MTKVVVVGSGASGVHFTLSILEKGYDVTLLDVGWEKPPPVNPEDSINDLKVNLKDPVKYFLGRDYEAVVYPGSEGDYYTKYYGTPPSKSHVFDEPHDFGYEAEGMVPLFSFAQGGLAEAWTGGAYPFNDDELKEFPFQYSDIEPYYGEVASRIGLVGAADDLARFFPIHQNLLTPLRLDEHSEHLVAEYEKRKSYLNDKYKCYLGRSRVTAMSADTNGRNGCSYCGRCLWGCPTEALYTPSLTLRECLKHPNLTYVPNMFVSHFRYSSDGRVLSVIAESVDNERMHEFTADRFVLAAGTLSSSKIYLDSIFLETGEVVKLTGLMDNRQILIPFLNLRRLGKAYDPNSYQYHQLAVGIESERPEEYIHGQITTLKSATVHPIIQNVPFDLRTAMFVFRNVRAGLGVVNLNLHDRRRESSYVTLQPNSGNGRTKLAISYEPPPNEDHVINRSLKTVKRFLWELGCIVPPGMVHVRPMGASVHYSGTIPMSTEEAPHTASKYCRSHNFENLYFTDGTTFPFLPAKNVTFSLMANAVRLADNAF